MRGAAVLLGILLTAGCAEFRPNIPQSEGHISQPQVRPEADKPIPPPARTSAFVPPPKPAVKPQTYSVVVNEVPVKELLLALARDTKQNIDIHPGLTGLVSLNAINETLPAILDRLSKQVNLRYHREGNTIIVSPDTPHVKTYRVNYVNVTRKISSTVNVTGEVGSGVGPAGAAGTGGQPGTSGSKTEVTSTTSNDFWEQLRDNIRAILASTHRLAASAEEKAARAEETRAAREEALKRAEAVSRAGPGAADLLKNAFPQQQRTAVTATQSDTGTDVIINPISGTITVLATEQQHQLIQQHLDSIVNAVQRQVLIEATIVEVELSQGYQGGIDWSRLAISGGITFTQALLGGFNAAAQAAGAAAGNAITIGYQNPTSSVGNISATVKLLQEFGNTRVLSSPKLMTLNNQAALLKVVDNIVYFEVQSQANTTQGVATQTVNTTPKTVSVGVVMGVTPQINEDGRVTLTVRPTISRVLRFKDDPNPTLVFAGQRIPNQVPEIQVREMESVLQVGSGQTVILGGLMQDEGRYSREQLPGADRLSEGRSVGGPGDIFRFRDERAVKTELVIFLRPTVVANASLESDELRFFQRFLPQPETPPAEKTGAAR
ncbi:MAG: secretin N-terminal domain-containing protein [Burkholderiales bacterium]|nr:secretin N-terminal domain-containing protein [Burkholderiales bacterium]